MRRSALGFLHMTIDSRFLSVICSWRPFDRSMDHVLNKIIDVIFAYAMCGTYLMTFALIVDLRPGLIEMRADNFSSAARSFLEIRFIRLYTLFERRFSRCARDRP